jgi:hypothetical protein
MNTDTQINTPQSGKRDETSVAYSSAGSHLSANATISLNGRFSIAYKKTYN